jgi:hypothetical protein
MANEMDTTPDMGRVMQLLALYQALIDENEAYYKQEGIL